jgi:hypothetical protein
MKPLLISGLEFTNRTRSWPVTGSTYRVGFARV